MSIGKRPRLLYHCGLCYPSSRMIRKLLKRVFKRPSSTKRTTHDAPATIPAKSHGIQREAVSPAARRTCETLQEAGHKAFVVGGAVRDLIAGIKPKDFDVATDATPDEIETRFGREVRLLVQEVTDDKSLPKPERKRLQVEHAPHASSAAQLIKIADKLSNSRDMKNDPPEGWSVERRIEYLDFSDRVVEGCRGVSEVLEACYDAVVRDSRETLSG